MRQENVVERVIAVVAVVDENNTATSDDRQITDQIYDPTCVFVFAPAMRNDRQFIGDSTSFVAYRAVDRGYKLLWISRVMKL